MLTVLSLSWMTLFTVPVPLAEQAWQGAIGFGPHDVGFRCETLIRATGDTPPRTLTTCVWYPAVARTGRAGSLADLFAIVLDERQLTEADGLSKARGLVAAMTGDAEALPIETADIALTLPVYARIEAEPASGRFPLAVWSSRHATVLAQAPLSEALASHGFVVATIWSSDPPLAFLWEDHPESEKVATIEIQSDDLAYGLSILRRRSNVDPERTVVLAWSYGGQTAARLQERDDFVQGVIGLDANVVPARAEERLSLEVPFVWLLGRDTGRRGLESVRELAAPTVVLILPELAHGNFNALEGFLPGLLKSVIVFPWSTGGQTAVDGYGALIRIVIEAAKALTQPSPSLIGFPDRALTAAGDVSIRVAQDRSRR